MARWETILHSFLFKFLLKHMWALAVEEYLKSSESGWLGVDTGILASSPEVPRMKKWD